MFATKIQNTFKQNKFEFLLLSLFPIFLIIGNLVINLFYITLFIISILNYKKKEFFYNHIIFYLLVIFLGCLFLNLFFTINFYNSVPRFLKFFLIFFFIIELQRLNFENSVDLEKIFKFWIIVFLIVTIDIIFELIFGYNSLGFTSSQKGRIASFFNDELIVGSFYHFFGLIFIGFLLKKNYPNYQILVCGIFLILISFVIGERANFLRMFISIFLILFFIIKINVFYRILSLCILIMMFILIINNSENLRKRYLNQLDTIYTKKGIIKYFKESQYGAHQSTAFEIYKNNKLFGVGMKNFREESNKEIYKNIEYKWTDNRQATHPHQIHLELLSETGIVGYFSFFILIITSIFFSINNYLKHKNPIQFSTIVFLCTSILPLLPSGSIFSTYYGGIFWFNYALMLSFNLYAKSKN